MENKKRYCWPGSYSNSNYRKVKVITSKQSDTIYSCYLVAYSHANVTTQPYSEVHSESFACLIYKSEDITICTEYVFDTEAEAIQYFEATVADNVEQRYAKPLQED